VAQELVAHGILILVIAKGTTLPSKSSAENVGEPTLEDCPISYSIDIGTSAASAFNFSFLS